MAPDGDHSDLQRRQFIKGVTAGSALLGITGAGAGQALASGSNPDIYLFADEGAWEGEIPEEIDGVANPDLALESGKTYTLTWENDDALPHNFVIIDSEGNEVVRTPIREENGVTETVEFTVPEGADWFKYFCEFHPGTMRGDVLVDGQQPEGNLDSPVPEGETIDVETVATGLTSPLGFEVAPGDDRRFIVDQVGKVFALQSGELTEFLDVRNRIVDLGIEAIQGYDERGLLGLAFHPEFDDNGKFYVRYSAPSREGTPADFDHTDVLSEFQVEPDFGRADDDSERVLMEVPSPQTNHNGGALAFGPDGYLYSSIGDGGDADDTGLGHVEDWYDENAGGNGQDVTENLLGSIHRIDVDSREDGKPYGIPDDNPLVGTEGLDEQFAWGFRNPWRMSFNEVPGSNERKLFVADAGQNRYEEVDIVEKGGNYGWNVREGTHCFSTDSPNDPPADCPTHTPDSVRGGEPLLDPIIEYEHREHTTAFIDGAVVIGGFMYQNDTVPAMQGKYVFGNWSGRGVIEPDGEIFAATPPADGDGLWSVEELRIASGENGRLGSYVQAFGRDHEGELYVLTNDNFTPTGDTGAVHKLVSN